MLTEFVKGRKYVVQDYKTLVMTEGVRKADCGWLTASLYETQYHKRMEPDVAGEVFTGEGGDLAVLHGWLIRPWMCEEVLEPKKTVYIAGNMLTKDSQLLRAQEREEIEQLGYDIYNPQDNKEINDKANLDNNDSLAEKIVRQDTDALIKSDIIVIEPQPYALGTMVELGQLKGMKDMASILMSIVKDPRLDDIEVREYIQEECQAMLDKLILPHYEDIRRVDTPETGDRRSLGINQYVYGVALDLSNGQGFYDWADILLQLKGETK